MPQLLPVAFTVIVGSGTSQTAVHDFYVVKQYVSMKVLADGYNVIKKQQPNSVRATA
jgi:hypothetical protein